MRRHLSQGQFIAIGFILMILIGALLLDTPMASRSGQSIGFLSALFTATSASCVTGLVVADTATQWTLFGQIVVLILIQIGGLGFISIGVFFSIILRRKIGLRERGLMMESANALQLGGIVKFARRIVAGTAIVEGVGALLLMIRFIPEFGVLKGIWYGIFHSVSAFCNGGFDLMGAKYGKYSSLVAYYDDPLVNIVIMSLIVIGGIGFVVWGDLLKNRWHFKKYLLHTKIVLLMSTILIFGGALLFYWAERNGVLKGMSVSGQILSSLFASVTARTAGFNTVDTAAMSGASKLLTAVLMFIGGSPGSTAGGIKTTTLFVLLMGVKKNVTGAYGIQAFGKRLEDDTLATASIIATLNMGITIIAIFIVMGMQPFAMQDVVFEAFSASGTVGITAGITRDLNTVSRILMIMLMYLGRVGSLSFALAFMESKKKPKVMLPKESISIG
jgi:potassium uptake protein, trkH family